MKKILMISLICLLVGQCAYAVEGTWTTIDYPGASETYVNGIDGSNAVGYYTDASGYNHGFFYNIEADNWTDLPIQASAIDGSNVVGGNQLYNITDQTLTTLNVPGNIRGISGTSIVGWYETGSFDAYGFLYNGTTWRSLFAPGAQWTLPWGIQGNNIVGYYVGLGSHGFIYDGTTWTTIDMPGARKSGLLDIDGSNLVGWWCQEGFNDFHGFFYNGTTWTLLDAPGATNTYVNGIDGSKIVGYYTDTSGNNHGFIYELQKFALVACIADVNQPIEAQGPFGAKVTLDGSCSSDTDSTPGTNDDINDFDWYEIIDPCKPDNDIFLCSGQIFNCNLPLGTHTVILEVIDKAGATDSNEITVTIEDTTPPEFNLSVTPKTLWPANHKMIKITPTWTATDLCDPSPEISLVNITMNEPCNPADIRITPDGSIYFCATRSGNSKGRIYTLTYEACDASDNCTVKTATVTVPHDMRK